MVSEPSESKKSGGWRPVIEKLLQPEKYNAIEFSEEQRKQFLQDSRESVDIILSQLGSFHASCQENRESMDEAWTDISKRHEKVIEELSATKELWYKSAKALGVDPTCSLNKLLAIIQGLSKLRLMREEQENLKQRLDEYKEAMKQTASCLKAWYKITGSQKKQIDLRHASILQSEARNVLAYKETKKTKLAKLYRETFSVRSLSKCKKQSAR